MQAEIDEFYDITVGLLDRFYPKQTVTGTSKDPDIVTARTKALLRRKNHLINENRDKCIGKAIVRHNRTRLSHVNNKSGVKDFWQQYEKDKHQSC